MENHNLSAKTQFLDKVLLSRAHRIFLVRGKEHGIRPCYCYVMVDAPKVQAFQSLESGFPANLKAYGAILKSGYGNEPPDAVKKYMKETYHFE